MHKVHIVSLYHVACIYKHESSYTQMLDEIPLGTRVQARIHNCRGSSNTWAKASRMHGPRPAPQTRGQRRAECTVQDRLLKHVGKGEQNAQSKTSIRTRSASSKELAEVSNVHSPRKVAPPHAVPPTRSYPPGPGPFTCSALRILLASEHQQDAAVSPELVRLNDSKLHVSATKSGLSR